ncbi:MAG: DUF3098 domain-containing protein [Bacteroidales bacterium]|nr:DUF3098 domain-containing protein [Lentimicrobiaceae bacterium]MBQ2907732.1 DUF3098 domain-containing protein [Bacteroidales bacterium]MBQ3594460.1 DUF3098 domain-containing protein [Bacteroidales bacterium]MBR3915258.1 DUF3098 domain-containing protein [Bacteroidales bacterium]
MNREEKNKQNVEQEDNKTMPFGRDNYLWVIIGLAFLLIGFLLMIGGGSDDPDVFNDAIFNFRRLTLAPILVLIGFGIQIYAIMKKPKNK